MIFKDMSYRVSQEKTLKKNEEAPVSASQVFTSLLSDDNVSASNRAEQPVNKKGNMGDFTNFDTVDYEIEKHIVMYNIEDWVDKTDESLKVKSTMDYVIDEL